MKKAILIFYVCLFISCNSQINKQLHLIKYTNQIESTPLVAITVQISQKDTLVKISADWAMLFLRYDEKMELWYEPYIVDLNNNDTIKIKNYNYENGSIPEIIVSPNVKYFVLDNIIKGYVETEEGEKLYENYTCMIIDVENANSIMTMQEHCGGKWNNENNWVSGDEIIFYSK